MKRGWLLKSGLVVLVLGIMSIGIGGKGCPWLPGYYKDGDGVISGSSGTLPNAPSGLTANAVSSSQIDLSWTDNSNNENGFEIERKTGAGGTYSQIAEVEANATSYSDTELTGDTTYYYRVRAYNSTGNSSYSNEAWNSTDTWIWTATTTTDVPDARWLHTAVWNGTNNEMIIWGGYDGGAKLDTGGKYYPITDTWVSITTDNAPISRRWHTAIWTGTEMIVYGGNDNVGNYLNTGSKYYPITDTWVSITTTDAPTSRTYHTAIWTESEMIVWGGSDGANIFNTGAKYYPITDTWVSITTTDGPISRAGHTAIWTGKEMIVWSGWSITDTLNTGSKYYPITDTWVSITTTNAPSARWSHTAVWTGTEMIIWGGLDEYGDPINTGAKYNLSTDTWTPITTANAPSAREYHTAVWTGSEMIIWGGDNTTLPFNTGGKYNPSTNTWVSINTTGTPTKRSNHTAIWTGTEMIIWGGGVWNGVATPLNTGGRYKP